MRICPIPSTRLATNSSRVDTVDTGVLLRSLLDGLARQGRGRRVDMHERVAVAGPREGRVERALADDHGTQQRIDVELAQVDDGGDAEP